RVIAPLGKMGANIVAEGPEETPPLRIYGGSLRGIRYRLSVASAQVKSALLLAGLFAKGKTTVEEPVPTRNHTELMLNYFLVRTVIDENGTVTIFGDQVPESRDFTIPGDISSAAFWLVAAAAQPRGHLLVRDVGLNNTRTALLGVLLRMGAQVSELTDGLEIYGRAPLQGARVASFGDHRIAMAFGIAGLFADGETIVQDADCIRESYPRFETVLEEFTNQKRMQISTPVI